MNRMASQIRWKAGLSKMEIMMRDVRTILAEMLKQIDVSDQYANAENTSRVPSVWQIQNGHLRTLAKDALDSATSRIT